MILCERVLYEKKPESSKCNREYSEGNKHGSYRFTKPVDCMQVGFILKINITIGNLYS